MLDRNKTVFEILLKDMATKSLDHQLKLISLVMVYVEISARENVRIHYKATGSDMQNLVVAEVIVTVFHTVIVI